MESVMENIEKQYPNLINCLGRLDYNTKKCNECRSKDGFLFTFDCLQISRELRRRCFAPGKYRAGFGRRLPNKKTVEWVGDRDDI